MNVAYRFDKNLQLLEIEMKSVLMQGKPATRQTGIIRRVARYSVIIALQCWLLFPQVHAQASNASWLTGARADALWSEMAQSPYAQTGNHGLVVYMVSYSSCGNCILFLRDFWDSRRADMQLREIFAPVNQPRYLNEAADIALTRSAEAAEAYYKQRLVAPPVNNSTERLAALQRVTTFTTKLNSTFAQIGHVQNSYPTFVFRVKEASGQDKLFIISGWGDTKFTQDLDQWVKGAAK